MPLNIEQKRAVVAEVSEVAANAISMVAAEYRGLTVSQLTALRGHARDKGVYVRVVPNKLAKRAFKDTPFECANDKLVGPLIMAFTKEEPSAAARVFKDFAKEHEQLKPMVVTISGKVYGPEQLNAVAALPTYDEALSRLLAVMKAPIEKFVRTLAAPHGKLVRTIAAVRDQKESA